MKNLSKILLLSIAGFISTITMAAKSIPPEAQAAEEAQQAALDYANEQDHKESSSHE